jgi:hypothetical protein
VEKKEAVKMPRRGVPKGYRHNWTYRGRWREKKVSPRKWRFSFNATKRTHAKAMGPRKGSKVMWDIKARQIAVKTKKGTYQTRMVGTKRLVKARMK